MLSLSLFLSLMLHLDSFHEAVGLFFFKLLRENGVGVQGKSPAGRVWETTGKKNSEQRWSDWVTWILSKLA